MEENFYSKIACEYLRKLNFNVGAIGFDYLNWAIVFCLEDESCLDGITTKLYPKVAKMFGVKESVVERGIRSVIDKTYQNGGLLEINTLYNKIVYNNDFKFSNSEFISLIVYRIKFDLAKATLAKKYNIKLPKVEDWQKKFRVCLLKKVKYVRIISV